MQERVTVTLRPANTPSEIGTAMPPVAGAPSPLPPIATNPEQQALSPWPVNDRFPIVIGQGLNFTYLSSVFRLASTGYRQQLVDLFNELLETDTHLLSVVSKRILSVANGRVEIVPVDLPEDHPDFEKAKKLAAFVQSEVDRVPDLTQKLQSLLWAIYTGVAACEIFWTRDSDGWHVERLEFVHSRRLAYPDYQTWDLFIWDQGQVYGWQAAFGQPTNANLYGLRIADWPGKYIVYCPQLKGDYPTREGIGRPLSIFAVAKKLGVRGAMSYLERFAKGFMDVSWKTYDSNASADGTPQSPREATDEDIAMAKQIASAIGPGSGSDSVHPDSITVEPKAYEGTGTAKLTWPEWIQICDAQMSKCALGGTLGTEVGKGGGNRNLGEVQERAEVDLEQYDATTLGECIKRDLVSYIVRLNQPDQLHLTPHVLIHVDTDPDPKSLCEVAGKMVDMGAPVDADKLADQVGLELVPNETGKPRRLFKSDVADPFAVDDDLKSEEAKAAEQEEKDRQHEVAKTKASQPTVVGAPGAGAAGKKNSLKGKPTAKGKPDPKSPAPTGTSKSKRNLADKPARPAEALFEQLSEDYPREAILWIKAVPVRGPVEVDVSQLDFANRSKWKASQEPDRVDWFASRMEAGDQKPVFLIKRPNKKKLMIADGHHRSLAAEKAELPLLAYIATVHTEEGPWDELHDSQRSEDGLMYSAQVQYSRQRSAAE